MLRPVIILCAFALSACVQEPSFVTQPPEVADTCGIAARSAYVGQPISALVTAGLAGGARIIRPGDAVTEDYSTTRLNVDLDADDGVTRLWCG